MRKTACLLLFSAALIAQPEISSIAPSGAPAGHEVTLRLEGRRLDRLVGLLASEPGITLLGIEAKEDRRATLRLQITAEARVGRHALWAHGDRGLSAPFLFAVGSFPEVLASEVKGPLTLPCTIDGRLRSAEALRFELDLEAGPLAFEVEGLRLGPGIDIDPLVELCDAAGRLIAQCDDDRAGRLDPHGTFEVTEAGRYVLTVRDARWRGGAQHRLRIHLASGARPTALLAPPTEGANPQSLFAGRADESKALALMAFGRTLARPEIQGYFWPVGVPWFGGPGVRSHDPNDAKPLPLPLSGVGVIAAQGESDRWVIDARKDQRLTISIHARKDDSPLDANIGLVDARGRLLAQNDDLRGAPDSGLNHRVTEDGPLFIDVRDRLNRGALDFAYRIEVLVAPEGPAASIERPRRNAPTLIAVPQDGQSAALLNIARGPRGAAAALDLVGLPPGVELLAANFTPDGAQVALVLRGRADAELAAGIATLALGQGAAQAPLAFTTADPLVVVENDRVLQELPLPGLPIGLTVKAPFRIEVEAPKVPIVQDSSQELVVRAIRDDGFQAAIALRLLHLPGGISASRPTIAANATEARIAIDHRGARPEVPLSLVVVASATVGQDQVEVASAPFALSVAGPFARATIGRARGELGAEVALPFEVQRVGDGSGSLIVEARQLPRGVTATFPETPSGSVSLKIAESAPLGAHKSLLWRVRWDSEFGPMFQDLRGGELRVDPELAPTERAKPRGARGTVENPKT